MKQWVTTKKGFQNGKYHNLMWGWLSPFNVTTYHWDGEKNGARIKWKNGGWKTMRKENYKTSGDTSWMSHYGSLNRNNYRQLWHKEYTLIGILWSALQKWETTRILDFDMTIEIFELGAFIFLRGNVGGGTLGRPDCLFVERTNKWKQIISWLDYDVEKREWERKSIGARVIVAKRKRGDYAGRFLGASGWL